MRNYSRGLSLHEDVVDNAKYNCPEYNSEDCRSANTGKKSICQLEAHVYRPAFVFLSPNVVIPTSLLIVCASSFTVTGGGMRINCEHGSIEVTALGNPDGASTRS